MNHKLYHLIFIDDDKDFLRSMNMALSSKDLAVEDEVRNHILQSQIENILDKIQPHHNHDRQSVLTL